MTVSVVQHAKGGTTPWTTGLTVTAGNYLIVAHAGQSPIGGGTSSISDSLSTVYTQITTTFASGFSSRTSEIYIWGGFVPTTGALTITQMGTFGVTLTAGDAAGGTLYVFEFSGVDPTTPYLAPIANPTTGQVQYPTTSYMMIGVAAQIWYNVGNWYYANAVRHVEQIPNGSILATTDHCDTIWFGNGGGGPVLSCAVLLNPLVTPTTFTQTVRENYINHYPNAVGLAGIDATSGTLSVTAVAPEPGGFRITVDTERMFVNSGGTTTNWNVTRAIEGSSATTHGAGTNIYSTWTMGSYDQIRKDRVGYGTTLPSTAVAKKGDYFALVQNGGSQYSVPFIFNGTVWQPLATNRAIPTAWDDDFDGSTMDMNKWIRYDPASIKSYVADSMNCSWLSLDCFNAGVIQRAYGYMQPVPSGNWTFRMKYANDCATGQHYGPGGFVMNAGGKMIIGIGASMIHSQTGTYWFIRQKDGIIASESDAYALSTYLVTPPAFIGFSLHPYGDSSSNPKMGMTGSWDWFRRVA